MTTTDLGARKPGSTRRQFLLGGAVAGVAAAAAIGIDYALNSSTTPAASPEPTTEPAIHGGETVAFHGNHQAGIATDAQAHGTFIGLDLKPEVDRDGLRRLMRILTDDAARLTAGEPALADSEPEMATTPARLTVTFGFGPGFVTRAGGSGVSQLPAFGIDRLQPEFSEGDLLMQIAGDDPTTVAHAARMLLKDTRSVATVRWTQHGFRRAYGTEAPGTTMRNLFGQVDGTSNPRPGTADFDSVVWRTDGWLAGGTTMVIRRIHMDLEGWDRVDRVGRDQSIGRTLSNGAPLTGVNEHDEPDFEAKNAIGFPVIPEYSHMRRSRTDNPTERIFRRAYNYDVPPVGEELSNSGLIFAAFQADVDTQYVPIQRRLDELDMLNEWTVPIGSSVFAIPPGCQPGGYIGETLLG